MSFTNVLSITVTTRSDKDKQLYGFQSSQFSRIFFRPLVVVEVDSDSFCSYEMCVQFDSCLSVANIGEC